MPPMPLPVWPSSNCPPHLHTMLPPIHVACLTDASLARSCGPQMVLQGPGQQQAHRRTFMRQSRKMAACPSVSVPAVRCEWQNFRPVTHCAPSYSTGVIHTQGCNAGAYLHGIVSDGCGVPACCQKPHRRRIFAAMEPTGSSARPAIMAPWCTPSGNTVT